ncbi:hypothetical protein ACJX0J_009768, partial [Zea mays]
MYAHALLSITRGTINDMVFDVLDVAKVIAIFSVLILYVFLEVYPEIFSYVGLITLNKIIEVTIYFFDKK